MAKLFILKIEMQKQRKVISFTLKLFKNQLKKVLNHNLILTFKANYNYSKYEYRNHCRQPA